MSTPIKTSLCPDCGAVLDAVTRLRGEYTPKPGDVCVCLDCMAFLTFEESQAVVKVSPEELAELQRQCPDVWQSLMEAAAVVRIYNHIHPPTERKPFNPFKN